MTNLAERRVLFVSQDATRTGAPVLLLQFLRWLRTNTSIDFEVVVLRQGGELSAEFAALAPVWHADATTGRLAGTTMRVARRLGLTESVDDAQIGRMVRQMSHRRFGLVYSNTFWNGAFVSRLGALGCPVVTHVHELESNISRPGAENLRLVKAQTTGYIACSEAVKSNLVVRHRIEPDRIDVIHGFVTTRALTAAQQAEARARTRLELGIPEDACVVGAAGTTNWAKSPDLFVQLAYAVHRRRPARPVHFVWLGGGSPHAHRLAELRLDAQTAGIGDIMHFPGTRSNAAEYFCAFDVFALTSREDSFPLACLEVASLGKPILCFDRAGGEREFVEHDCGFVVPYLEVEVMAERTLELLASDELRHRMGERAQAKVRERHDVSYAAPRVLDVIRRLQL